mgnify:CR=1 FL=1
MLFYYKYIIIILILFFFFFKFEDDSEFSSPPFPPTYIDIIDENSTKLSMSTSTPLDSYLKLYYYSTNNILKDYLFNYNCFQTDSTLEEQNQCLLNYVSKFKRNICRSMIQNLYNNINNRITT